MKSGATLQYAWTTSDSTEAPTTWSTANVSSYSSGATSTTATISKSDGTGQYYLWIKPNVSDTSGNTNTKAIRTGPWYFDNTKPTSTGISTNKIYTNKPSVTVYVNGVSDVGAGIRSVYIAGWYVITSWKEYNSWDNASYDSANDRYYKTVNFADLPNTDTGTYNQGDGKYQFNSRFFDNAKSESDSSYLGNSDLTSVTEVYYDTTAPVWNVENISKDTTNKTITANIVGTDALSGVASSTLTASKITVYIDGEEVSDITKTLGTATTSSGKITHTLTLSNIENVVKQTGKEYLEWSGTVQIVISSGTLKDNATNTSAQTTLNLGFIDSIKPEITYTQSYIDSGNKKYTMTFDVTDKYYTSGEIALENLIILMKNGQKDASGNEIVNDLKQLATEGKINISLNKVDKTATFRKTVSGSVEETANEHVIGHTYTLTISNLEKLEIETGKTTADYSGIITVAIAGNVIKDSGPNGDGTSPNGNDATTITSGIDIPEETDSSTDEAVVDVVDPLWTKISSTAYAIDPNNKESSRAEITFKGTDTYFDESTLTSNNIKVIVNGSEVTTGITKTLSTATNLTEERIHNGTTSTVQYGVQYTLTITGFAQNANQVKIRIPAGTLVDESGNGNKETDFTVYNVLKSTESETEETSSFLDSVSIARQDIEKVIFTNSVSSDRKDILIRSYDAQRNIASGHSNSTTTWKDLTEKQDGVLTGGTWGTDYISLDGVDDWINLGQVDFENNKFTLDVVISTEDLTSEEAEVIGNWQNGGLGIYLSEGKPTLSVAIKGEGYKKVQSSNAIVSGEKTRITGTYDGNTMALYINGELSATQNITGTIMKPELNTVMAIGVNPAGDGIDTVPSWAQIKVYSAKVYSTSILNWDVSAQGDGSIVAWTSNTTAPYTVYIGSNDEIFANQDSRYLFSYIGYGPACTAETAIANLNLLNVSSVTKMRAMFYYCGYTAMTSLNLGNKFDTSNVTTMQAMFYYCGYTAMASLNLGDKFDTSNVTTMRAMFDKCGYNALTSFNLGDKFDTSKVTTMYYMFQKFGYKKLTSLDLGNKFDTSNVTDMSYMFNYTGYEKMTSLDLGDKFDTSNVTNTSYMFAYCGCALLTSLDLGDKFDTSSVTNMQAMFYMCGNQNLEYLDLGPQFTRIRGFDQGTFYGLGELLCCIIYAPESIYYGGGEQFKENSSETELWQELDLGYNTRGSRIIPIYRPQWSVIGTTVNNSNKTLAIDVKGSANYTQTVDSNVTINYASNVTSTLSSDDITVYVDGVEVTSTVNPTVTVSTGANSTNATTGKTEVTHTITLSNLEEAARRAGIPYKELSGNIAIKIGGRGQATSTYTANVLTDEYGNQSMMEVDITGITWDDVEADDWTDVLIEDETKTDHNTANTMFADYVKPEFTYEYANTTIGSGASGNKKVSVIFDVTDKYFNSTTLTANDITVKVSNTEVNTTVNVTKTLTKKKDIIINTTTNAVSYKDTGYTLQTNERKVGERYELLVEGLEQLDENGLSNGYTYSGPMTMAFPSGKVTDKSGNVNVATTITIGVDETDGNPQNTQDPNGAIVDVVDPVWELGDVDLENRTIKIIAKDKYFDRTNIVASNITVYINGVISTTVGKEIAYTRDITDTVDGEVKVVGKEYTLELSGIETENGIGQPEDYTTFTPTNLTTDSLNNNAGFKYRNDVGGEISIKISTGTIYDESGNTNREQEFEIGNMDGTKPEIYEVQKVQNTTAKTETIIFNVTDLNYDSTDLITTDEISVYIDETEVESISKTITQKEIKANINGTTKTVGHQYTLVLSNIAETTYQTGKEYLEWSGTLRIEIEEDATKDIAGNTLNTATTSISDFVDFIKPQITYTHQSSDIDYGNKKYTMTFDVTEKYYTSGEISLDNLTILMKNGQKDASGNEIVKDLKQLATAGIINISLNKVNKTATFRKTVSGSVEETATEHVIGHTYTLTISNLEKLEIETGKTTADYSGIITVGIAGNIIKDNGPEGNGTNPNGNDATTITSGIDIPEGTGSSTDEAVVDVVDPLWTKISSTASAIDPDNKESSTAEITFKGTDTYFDENTLTVDKIKVIVNGSEVTTGITKTLSTATSLTEERIHNGTTSTVQYGVQYTLTITGFAQNANQVKIRIPAGTLVDESGNGNKETDLILYNVLKSTASETESSSMFLGESVATTLYPTGITSLTTIQRQDIEKVIFTNDISGSTASGVQRIWDVSAQGDGSIVAWTSNTTAPYTVYIGSEDEIFANQNSSFLFRCIGYSSSCTSSECFTNIELLNTRSVTSMASMFRHAGYAAMTSLNLGNNFYTENVTDMQYMFYGVGLTAMTSFNLGENFDTSSVTNMNNMLAFTGYNEMTSLDLGTKFDTSSVTNMSEMFYGTGCMKMISLNLGANFDTSEVLNMYKMFSNTGSIKMTSLDLGDNFDTSNVTNMSEMFYDTGSTAMTSLNLRDKFDTSKVTNMEKMFYSCGKKAMTSLDLGNKFDTSQVTNMKEMFAYCGMESMTVLDLGAKFTHIATNHENFITDCGTSNLVIYAPEKIYYNKTTFKLD